jgi:hypothetical protein
MMTFSSLFLKIRSFLASRSQGVGVVLLATVWFITLGWSTPIYAQSAVDLQVTQIIAPAKSLAMPTAVAAFHLPLTDALDPDTLWSKAYPQAQAPNPQGLWMLVDNQRTAAKFTLSSENDHIYTLEFPLTRLDLVDVFWRAPGKPWDHARGGDTIRLSDWPVVGQYPTFVLHFESLPSAIDVLVVMQNAGFAQTAVILNVDRESRERRLMQANASGFVIGASAMALLVSLLLCVVYRSAGSVYLLVYSLAVTLGAIVLNGYGAIWFTPNWPRFNDSIKPMAATLTRISSLVLGASPWFYRWSCRWVMPSRSG